MEEEKVDTLKAPVDESGQADEPTEDESQESEVPEYLTAAQAQELLDKQAASFQSWLGRRDKETFNHIGDMIEERIKNVQPKVSNDELSTRLLESPREFVRQEFEALQNEQTTKQTRHLNTTMETVGELMESDPLYADKDLGNEVVEEIKKMVQTGKIDYNVKANVAGKIVLADALSNVFRRRQNKKVSPLEGNKPGNGASSLTPPEESQPKVKVPKLDDVTKRMADKWGYNDEDLARVFGN